jgi:hypothetical protein
MRALAWWALLSAAVAGCSPELGRCKAGTLLVTVRLDGTTAAADELRIVVALDGMASPESTLPHTASQATGNVVVEFPHGYPLGSSAQVTVTAFAGGALVGRGVASIGLACSCEAVPLSVSAVESPDLATLDLLEPVADDLATDLALSDGSPPDLIAADLTPVCVPKTEDCFNGVDDDCDGKTDCADSDCTAGAVCVPAVGAAFTAGITVADTSFCPGSFASRSVFHGGLSPAVTTCPANGCSCAPGINCGSVLYNYTSAAACNMGSEASSIVSPRSTCSSFIGWNGTVATDPIVVVSGGASCGPSGTSTVPAQSWGSSRQFCKATQIGGGCAAGKVCVPAVAAPRCEIADGTVACDPGYDPVAGPLYKDFSDTRTCTCSCPPASGGSCGATTIGLYTGANCTGTLTSVNGGVVANCNVAGGPYVSTRINGGSLPTCGAALGKLGGALTGTGPQTVCCVP